jgi:hypothetical protein
VRPLGSSDLKTVELPDQLQFVYGYEPGWGALAWALSERHLVYAAIFVVIFISLVIYWLNVSPAKLSVTQRELVAQGSQNRNLANQTTIPASEVNSLAYAAAGKGSPAGLYAMCRRNQACLLPGLTPEQAAAVAGIIRTKFPKLERGDNIPDSLKYPEQHSKR